MSDLLTARTTGVSYAKDLIEKQGEPVLDRMIDLLDLLLTKTNGYPEETVKMLGELKEMLEAMAAAEQKAPCGNAYPACCSKSVGWIYSVLGSIVGGIVGAAIAVIIVFLFFA